MPSYHFTFSKLAPGLRSNAFLKIRLTNPANGHQENTIGLIDTGAAECSIPDWLALQLGHNLSAGINPATVQTAGGKSQALAHTAGIQVMDAAGIAAITIAASPMRVLPGLPFVLLGVSGFLEMYRLTVDYPKQRFSLEL